MRENVNPGENSPLFFLRQRAPRNVPALSGLSYVATASDALHLNISQMDTNAASSTYNDNAFSGGTAADAVIRTLGALAFNGTTLHDSGAHPGGYSDRANDSGDSGSIRYQVKEPDFELTVNFDGSSDGNNNNTSWMFVPSTYERGFMTSAHVGIVLCAVGIFFNLLLFVLLCSSRRLRFHYLYSQIMSISLADLGFVTMVDSFTVYFELQPWRLGDDFCKTWMILDVALPSVALLALLLLNVDRVLFTYKTDYYNSLMQNTSVHVLVILSPWCVSCVIVCSLWLGFPAVHEPPPGVCMYGITKEANAASSWLTVFLPSVLILILLIFVFIAVIGEMPSANQFTPVQLSLNGRCASNAPGTDAFCQSNDSSRSGLDRTRSVANTSVTSVSHARRQRRFVAALLAVDFVSLAITLPYSAYSLVSPICDDAQSCDSLRTLYQTLSWTRSSVACVRPILFIVLTDIYQSVKRRMINWYVGERETSSSFAAYEQTRRDFRAPCVRARNDFITLTQGSRRNSCSIRSINNSMTASTALTPPQSPFQFQPIEQTPPRTKTVLSGSGFSSLFKEENEGTFV